MQTLFAPSCFASDSRASSVMRFRVVFGSSIYSSFFCSIERVSDADGGKQPVFFSILRSAMSSRTAISRTSTRSSRHFFCIHSSYTAFALGHLNPHPPLLLRHKYHCKSRVWVSVRIVPDFRPVDPTAWDLCSRSLFAHTLRNRYVVKFFPFELHPASTFLQLVPRPPTRKITADRGPSTL